jgi:hypothetical protein
MYSDEMIAILAEYQAKHIWVWRALDANPEIGNLDVNAALPGLPPDQVAEKVMAVKVGHTAGSSPGDDVLLPGAGAGAGPSRVPCATQLRVRLWSPHASVLRFGSNSWCAGRCRHLSLLTGH